MDEQKMSAKTKGFLVFGLVIVLLFYGTVIKMCDNAELNMVEPNIVELNDVREAMELLPLETNEPNDPNDEAIRDILFKEEGIISLGIGEFREFYLDKVLYVKIQAQSSGVLLVWARPVDLSEKQEAITEETKWPINKIIYGDSLKGNLIETLIFLRRARNEEKSSQILGRQG